MSTKKRMIILGFGRIGKLFYNHIQSNVPKLFNIFVFDFICPSKKDFPHVTHLSHIKSLKDLTSKEINKFEVVINLLPTKCNAQILKVVPECPNVECYVDCSSFCDISENEVLKNSKNARKSAHKYIEQVDFFVQKNKKKMENKLALSNLGLCPGVDNILASLLISRGAKSISIQELEIQEKGNKAMPWCDQENIDGIGDEPVILENKKLLFLDKKSADKKDVNVTFTCSDFEGEKRHEDRSFPMKLFCGEQVHTLSYNFPSVENISMYLGGNLEDYIIEEYNKLKLKSGESSSHVNEEIEVQVDYLKINNQNEEPNGVFGLKVVSDIGHVEIIFESTRELNSKGHKGNYITYYTALSLWTIFNKCFIEEKGSKMKGLYFPETLPKEIQMEVLKVMTKDTRKVNMKLCDKPNIFNFFSMS